MNLDPVTLLAIAGMALVTFALRAAGLALAARFAPTGRMRAAFDAIPPAVLTAVIAPPRWRRVPPRPSPPPPRRSPQRACPCSRPSQWASSSFLLRAAFGL